MTSLSVSLAEYGIVIVAPSGPLSLPHLKRPVMRNKSLSETNDLALWSKHFDCRPVASRTFHPAGTPAEAL